MICFRDWCISAPQGMMAHQYDHLTRRLELTGELPEGWEWAVLVRVGDAADVIHLEQTEAGVGVDLTRNQLSIPGFLKLQVRGIRDDKVKHTNIIDVFLPESLTGSGQWPQLPAVGMTVAVEGETMIFKEVLNG